MGQFGKALFNSSPFIFWTLSPLLLIFAISLPFLAGEQSVFGWLIVVACSSAALMLILALYDAQRFHWVGRVLAGMVFLTYMSYLGFEVLTEEEPLRLPPSRGEAHPINAFFGIIVIGLPSLWYALFGRFTFRAESFEEENELESVEFADDE